MLMAVIAARMAELAGALEGEDTLGAAAQHVVAAAVDLVDGCSHAGLASLVRGGPVETLAARGPGGSDGPGSRAVVDADRLQDALGEGPCVSTAWDDALVDSHDLTTETRWPRWAPRAHALTGARSALCLRLSTRPGPEGQRLDALTLYAPAPGAFTPDVREAAYAIAAHAAVALSAAQNLDQMHTGLARRTVIGQATGIVMERYALDATTAFGVLRRISQEQNRKVHDIAEDLVEGRPSHGLRRPGP